MKQAQERKKSLRKSAVKYEVSCAYDIICNHKSLVVEFANAYRGKATYADLGMHNQIRVLYSPASQEIAANIARFVITGNTNGRYGEIYQGAIPTSERESLVKERWKRVGAKNLAGRSEKAEQRRIEMVNKACGREPRKLDEMAFAWLLSNDADFRKGIYQTDVIGVQREVNRCFHEGRQVRTRNAVHKMISDYPTLMQRRAAK